MRFGGIAALLVMFATSAHAGPAEDAKAKAAADAGAALFAKNDFAGAASKFREAYDLNHDPSYLFNIAQAYRHAGDCVRSSDFYGRFLADVPHPPNEDKIRVWYASETQCAKERTATPVEPPKQEPPKQEPPKQEPPKQEPPKHEATFTPGTTGSHHRGLVITLAATGAIAIGVGGFFAWDSGYLNDQRQSFLDGCNTSSNRCSSAVVNDYDRRGARANTISIVGFAAGGLAIAASATIYLLSGSSSETPPVAIAPVNGGAVVVRGFAF
ncbi:MAG TPA: hypothetical protein VL326_09250 [Kofleriaceae bacterium]|nr:hypothetical protein [Kofleriaceae bacterium]